ncbi:MAG: hypothetical protein D6730_08775 [Bacteroidetes bacterium]|nr:MAG: hypothetical protein D6730_08775 [Bacteroidota bacterium]
MKPVAMYVNRLVWAITLTLMVGCMKPGASSSERADTTEGYYQLAAEMCAASQYDSALVWLKLALEKGLEKPMRVVRDRNFSPLIDHPDYRPEIRSLLKSFASEHQATMVSKREAGTPLSLSAKVLDESTHLPVQHVQVELVQADHEGRYFNEPSKWNPRLFAYLITDEKGEFSIHTIRPGRYRDDQDMEVPAHIHFTLEARGYRMYASEFTFEDDSILMARGNTDGVAVALRQGEQGLYSITLYLQRE